MREVSIRSNYGYMPDLCGAWQVGCECGCREGVGAELELVSAAVMGYASFPKFVPTHVTNFGSTTSRSVARRNHARA